MAARPTLSPDLPKLPQHNLVCFSGTAQLLCIIVCLPPTCIISLYGARACLIMLDSFSVAWMAPSAIQRRSYRRQCCVRSVLSFRKLWTICTHIKRLLTTQGDVRASGCASDCTHKIHACTTHNHFHGGIFSRTHHAKCARMLFTCRAADTLLVLRTEETATQAGGAAHHGTRKHEGSFTERVVTLPCAPVTCLPLKSAQNAPTGPPWRASSATTLMAK